MRIRTAHAIVLLLHAAMALACVACLLAIRQAVAREQQAMQQHLNGSAALQGFREGSQLLSTTAQAAAATGATHQSEQFWRELFVARRRERAGLVLRQVGLTAEEQTLWRQALKASEALASRQQEAMSVLALDNRIRAMALVFDPATLQAQEHVRFLSESLQRRLDSRLRFALSLEQRQAETLWRLMLVLLLLDLSLVFGVFLLLTPRFITRPLVLLEQRLRQRQQGQSTTMPTLACAAREIQTLATALAAQERLEQALAQEQWVKSEQLRIGEALQRESTPPAAGSRLLRDLGRALELGAASLYGVDPAGGGLRLLASYGTGALPSALEAGEGLVGECLSQGAPLEFEHLPPGYFPIRSGLGASPPVALWCLPVRSGEQILAVLELALLHPIQPQQRQLVQELLPLLALALERFRSLAEPSPELSPEPCRL
ncbi:MAG: GAF domain-containing protein [Prochlorococcaceae cyanobacterium]|jgi:hypothetical protein